VADYINTAWEVPSEPAKTFARRFYEELLGRKPIGEAVKLARTSLYGRQDTACTWGAYQHHGDPRRTLLVFLPLHGA
jgi:CHAT domain